MFLVIVLSCSSLPLADQGIPVVAVLASLPLAIPFLPSVSEILWATGLKAWPSVYTGMFGRSKTTLLLKKRNSECLRLTRLVGMESGGVPPVRLGVQDFGWQVRSPSGIYNDDSLYLSDLLMSGSYCATSCPPRVGMEEIRLWLL